MNDIDIIRELSRELNVRIDNAKSFMRDSVGYILNDKQEVMRLSLYNCNLATVKRISTHLAKLKALTELNLEQNKLSDISGL
jgi:Leucine-rich repeat (LRR) protein